MPQAQRRTVRRESSKTALPAVLRVRKGTAALARRCTSMTPKNRLLSRVPRGLLPPFQDIRLEKGQELERPGDPVRHVYFPESGLVSVIATWTTKKIEVGMIGFEGMTGAALVLGSDRSAQLLLVQSAGWAQRLTREAFLATLDLPELRTLWLRYAHVLTVQASQTALANGTASMIQRLARWLVMWHDRMPDQAPNQAIAVTHEYIAILLGVRRAGITMALHRLEGDHLIKSDRRQITVLDRAGLVRLAKGFYGAPEAEYDRLIG
jgi:CRP-like cAMP-binding protein